MHSAVSMLMVAGIATTLATLPTIVDLNPSLANNTCAVGYGYGYSSDGSYGYGYGQCPTPPSSGGGTPTTATTTSTTTTTTSPTTTTTAVPVTVTTAPRVTTTTLPPKAPKPITTQATVTKSTVGVKLSCGKASCKGTIKLWYKNVLLGDNGYKLASGKTETIKVHLDEHGSKFLDKAKNHTLTVEISVLVNGGKTIHEKLKLVG